MFVTHQRTLNSLRKGNDSLRKQVDLAESARVAAALEPLSEPVARLNEADEKALLQLRSKIVALREQLLDTSNRVVILGRQATGYSPAQRQVQAGAP
jgi:hypothetical protein